MLIENCKQLSQRIWDSVMETVNSFFNQSILLFLKLFRKSFLENCFFELWFNFSNRIKPWEQPLNALCHFSIELATISIILYERYLIFGRQSFRNIIGYNTFMGKYKWIYHLINLKSLKLRTSDPTYWIHIESRSKNLAETKDL